MYAVLMYTIIVQGGLGRFINHSCEPNCEVQKWVVQGGEITIGLFTLKDIPANTELTFDYNLERYGDKVAVCQHALLRHAPANTAAICTTCMFTCVAFVVLYSIACCLRAASCCKNKVTDSSCLLASTHGLLSAH